MALHLSSLVRYVPRDGGNRDLPEDKQISLDIRPPKVMDMLEIQRLIRDAGTAVAPDFDLTRDPEQAMKLWDVMEGVVLKHTSNWAGIYLDGEVASDPAVLLKAVGMDGIALIAEVSQEVIAMGRGSESEAKNSSSESGPGSSGSASIASNASPPESSESATAAAAS